MQKPVYLTPGPSELYPTVEGHLDRAMKEGLFSMSHRSVRFEEIFAECRDNLRAILEVPADYEIFFMSSATEVWERMVQNCVTEHSFHLVNGVFSGRAKDAADKLGRRAAEWKVADGEGFDMAILPAPEHTPELLTLCVNESSTGVYSGPDVITELHTAFPDSLLAVDLVSVAPAVELDLGQTDIAYFSVQKCFGLPAGLSVVILSPRAIEKSARLRAEGRSTGTYRSFDQMAKYAAKHQTPETPNILGIYLLACVTRDMRERGIEVIREATRRKSELLYHSLRADSRFKPFVERPEWRSPTVTVFEAREGSAAPIARAKATGFAIGGGYGQYKAGQIRIANFPAHSEDTIRRLLAALLV